MKFQIVIVHFKDIVGDSTWDGVAMAYEGFFYWDDWDNYIGVKDERGMIKYMKTGSIMFKLQGEDHSSKSLKLFKEIGVEHEIWDLEKMKEMIPIYSHDQYDGTTRPDEDDHFWDKTGKKIEGAVYTPGSGYVSDPQLTSHNLQVAAEANGGEFLFNSEITEIKQQNGRVAGVTLKTGEQIDSPIVVNVAGPHSFVINRMADVEKEMNIKTKALRHEVHHVPSPEGYDFEKDGSPFLVIANSAFDNFPHKTEFSNFIEIKSNYTIEDTSKMPNEIEYAELDELDVFIENNLNQNGIKAYYIGRTTFGGERKMYFVTNDKDGANGLMNFLKQNLKYFYPKLRRLQLLYLD